MRQYHRAMCGIALALAALAIGPPFTANATFYVMGKMTCHNASWVSMCNAGGHIVSSPKVQLNTCVSGSNYRHMDGGNPTTCYWDDTHTSCAGAFLYTVEQSSTANVNNCYTSCDPPGA